MQTRKHSIIEAVVNTAVGFVLSMVTTAVVLPAFGLHPTFADNAGITACFTAVSLARQYALRRVFNRLARTK